MNVTFESGKLHYITGKNGVGKSTLFRILQGRVAPTESVAGVCVRDDVSYDLSDSVQRARACSDVRMVQQNVQLMMADQFSFIENVRLAGMCDVPGLSRLPQATLYPELLTRFGIDINMSVKFLSGGQRQILAIVMALQKQCSVLLLDEPTAALDEANATLVMQFLQDIICTTGITVIMICHDSDLLKSFPGIIHTVIADIHGMRSMA